MNVRTTLYLIALVIAFAAGLLIAGLWTNYDNQQLKKIADKYYADSEELGRIHADIATALGIAQGSSRSASELLADYRKRVEEREREIQAGIDRIIGQAGEGGIGAIEISNGIDGDIQLVDDIRKKARIIIDGLLELQK